MVPDMAHIIPVLHDAVVNRVIYIQLMPKFCASFSNNDILNAFIKLKGGKKGCQKSELIIKSQAVGDEPLKDIQNS